MGWIIGAIIVIILFVIIITNILFFVFLIGRLLRGWH